MRYYNGLPYRKYIQATAEERIVGSTADEIIEYASDIAGKYPGNTEREHEKQLDRIHDDLLRETIKQLTEMLEGKK